MNDTTQALQLKPDLTITQVPCIAHIIKLRLSDLLGKMKTTPKNDTAELECEEDRLQALRALQQNREIADTLNKAGVSIIIV